MMLQKMKTLPTVNTFYVNSLYVSTARIRTGIHAGGVLEYENRFANLMIIMRAISSPFYRQLLTELPIRTVLHREIVLTMKASVTLRDEEKNRVLRGQKGTLRRG